MKRRTLLMSSVSAAGLAISKPAFALFGVGDIVFDPTAYGAQLLQYAQQAKDYVLQLQQYVTQLETLKNDITNTIALPMQLWGQVEGTIWQVQSLSNAASLLSGNSGSIIQKLSSLGSYANQIDSLGTSITSLPDQFNRWQQQLGQSFSALGQSLGLQQSQLKTQAAFQQAIQSQASSAGGQMQAIQAGVQMAASNGAILQQIEQTLIGTAQATAQIQEVQADRQALSDAATQKFLNVTDLPTSGNQGFKW